MSEVRETLKKHRPNLTDSTLKTYVSIITNLYRKLNGSGNMVEYFKDHSKDVVKELHKFPLNSRKTALATLVSLTQKNDYREPMMADIKTAGDEQKEQKMSDKQKSNWMSQKEVGQIYKHLEKSRSHLFNKPHLTKKELFELMDYVILSLYVLIPPRRSKEYTLFKLRNVNEKENPHMSKNKFVFPTHSYKTGKTYGDQTVTIPRKLQLIIKKWTTKHDNDYLLFDQKGKPLTVSRLTILLNKIFGKRISSTLLRHIYISDSILKNMPALKELEKKAQDMGHSVAQQQLYRLLPPDKDTKESE